MSRDQGLTELTGGWIYWHPCPLGPASIYHWAALSCPAVGYGDLQGRLQVPNSRYLPPALLLGALAVRYSCYGMSGVPASAITEVSHQWYIHACTRCFSLFSSFLILSSRSLSRSLARFCAPLSLFPWSPPRSSIHPFMHSLPPIPTKVRKT